MNELRVVVVGPMYQQNLGYIARVSKNFGVPRLYIVNPRCHYKGKEAIRYSKHAKELLQSARVSRSINDATRGTFVVGTTALWRKTSQAFHNVHTPGELLKLLKRNKISRISLLIGRDDTGLTKGELMGCDATVFIPTSAGYPVLNISHALAILLYVFSSHELSGRPNAPDKRDIERMNRLIGIFVSKRKGIRDRKAVAMALRHIIARSSPTKGELKAISVALSPRE
jgi:TrmH family RNA methyltransferase